MPAIPVYPGQSNTYIPNHRATHNLRIGFSRTPKDFALNRYIQVVPVENDIGRYLKITNEQAMRIVSPDLAEHSWADGADRPQNNDGTELFNWLEYRTHRYDYGYSLGYKSKQQATWDIGSQHQAINAQRAMTGRTLKVHQVLGNNANWETSHIIDVTTIAAGAGTWDTSTTLKQSIKRSLNAAAEQILLSTGSTVRKKDLQLVLNPTAAHRISECQEIVDHIKGSPDAKSQIEGKTGAWSEWGLPDQIYGFDVVVEDASYVVSRRGNAVADRRFCMPDASAYLLARKGSIVAPGGDGPNFSTICIFVYEEMSVEELDDSDNRRLSGHVVDDFVPVMTASASAVKFDNILTP
jgi:hypothetical protein